MKSVFGFATILAADNAFKKDYRLLTIIFRYPVTCFVNHPLPAESKPGIHSYVIPST